MGKNLYESIIHLINISFVIMIANPTQSDEFIKSILNKTLPNQAVSSDATKSVPTIDKKSKKIAKKKSKKYSTPDENYKIISISFPEDLANKKGNKRFKVTVHWKSGDKGGRRDIKFGDKDVQEFIDHGDTTKRDNAVRRMTGYDTPFKPGYYRLHLLNSNQRDLKAAYQQLIKNVVCS